MKRHKQAESNAPKGDALTTRRAARDLMTAVTDDKQRLSEVLSDGVKHLTPPSRARAQRLATEGLRWSGRCDKLLGPYLRNKPDEQTLNMLRLALWEILGDGAAAHGVVDSAVSITRRDIAPRAGMVNAVLRNVLRGEPDWNAMPVPPLPKWLRKLVVKDHGKAVTGDIEAAHSRGAPLDLTVKPGKLDEVVAATGGVALPTGSVRLAAPGQISALPGYEAGDWWVQDAAAVLPVQMTGVEPGMKVLDLCAAPGGKTMQLAAAGADVTALDVSEKRLQRLHENLERTGLSAEVVAADALEWGEEASFDVVLLDAPCSATGTIRRHPDLPFARNGDGIDEIVALQAKLLDRALWLAKPGGRVVFCTCSLLHREGEAQLNAALERHPSLTVVPPEFDGLDLDWITPKGGLRLRPDYWPDLGGMDGFFVAQLQKPA